MKIQIAENFDQLSLHAARYVAQCMKASPTPSPLLCVASGDSPSGLYRELVREVSAGELDISGWHFAGLDEWIGMNGADPGSCRQILDQQLLGPLRIGPDRICFFDGRTPDQAAECARMEAYIARHGGLDVAILGLGMNGHIGLNEPGTDPDLRSHVSAIAPQTQQVGQKYFTRPVTLTQGITLGLATLMEARHLVLVVSGSKKAEILQRGLEEPASTDLPVSQLRHHPSFTVFCDRDAASRLHDREE